MFYYMAGSTSGPDGVNVDVLIGYPCRQDGPILPARDQLLCSHKSKILWCNLLPYNKSFIDQACSVKMAGYWPQSFLLFCGLWLQSWSIKMQKRT